MYLSSRQPYQSAAWETCPTKHENNNVKTALRTKEYEMLRYVGLLKYSFNLYRSLKLILVHGLLACRTQKALILTVLNAKLLRSLPYTNHALKIIARKAQAHIENPWWACVAFLSRAKAPPSCKPDVQTVAVPSARDRNFLPCQSQKSHHTQSTGKRDYSHVVPPDARNAQLFHLTLIQVASTFNYHHWKEATCQHGKSRLLIHLHLQANLLVSGLSISFRAVRQKVTLPQLLQQCRPSCWRFALDPLWNPLRHRSQETICSRSQCIRGTVQGQTTYKIALLWSLSLSWPCRKLFKRLNHNKDKNKAVLPLSPVHMRTMTKEISRSWRKGLAS